MKSNMSSELPLLAPATPRTPHDTIRGPSDTDEPAQVDRLRSSAPFDTGSRTAQSWKASRKPSQPSRLHQARPSGNEQSAPSPHGPSGGKTKGRRRTTRQPQYTPEEWDSMKGPIVHLYIIQSRPLDAVVQHMDQVHGFSPSPNMYKKKFKEWGLFKNQSSHQAESRVGISTEQLAERHRPVMAFPSIPNACRGKPAFLWQEMALSGWPDAEMKALGHLIKSATDYLGALFDQGLAKDLVSGWKGDSFGLIVPPGRADHSLKWKLVADQCHGASSLVQRDMKTRHKCHKTLFNVFRDIDKLKQYNDPWMAVYLWGIILYLRGISYRIEHQKAGVPSVSLAPQSDHLVGHTISRLARLTLEKEGSGCYMVDCLNLLRTFSLERMKLALERVFKACIDSFSKYLGDCHPVVLLMTARFLKYWPAQLADHVLPNYESLVAISEAQLGPSDERTITFLTEYMYIAHYHAHDKLLTHRLARKICMRTHELESVPQWGRTTYGLVLASKLLSKIEKDSGKVDIWQSRLNSLADKLRNGDRECQTRALQIRRMMANWYREAGNELKASEETANADIIFNYMTEVVVLQGGWDRIRPFCAAPGIIC
ncbi:uncharacterized protein LY79DRAFT_663728 [Colletotrichum navitas]|uniref:Clr5 domain-containing protein n=1 Tax=Colletotrichum navitas TaxID=681940 RepID=A0AAD8PKQ3_9PEZI|nr:uncharacterized protein LY79DRAFT_663728 [Colletotrichum navitas]KAK1569361.1 hypothetical protein LY79DRAFT_663728 [Colletotrichum navitas]